MTYGKKVCVLALFGLACVTAVCTTAQERSQGGRTDRETLPQPVYKVASKLEDDKNINTASTTEPAHPLQPALDMASKAVASIQANIKDYTCTLVKRERIDGKLQDHEYMFVKIRHQPFSVYTYFKAPQNQKGKEAIYVAGKNDGNLLGHGVGIQSVIGTVRLKPDAMIAMRGNRYPITEIGVLNLSKRLIEVGEQDKKFGECDVKFFRNAKIKTGDTHRTVTAIQVVHPVRRANFRFHKALIYVDDQYSIPLRFEAYDWPTTPDGKPPLLEEYTYLDFKPNVGLTDEDFDEYNTNYAFH